MEQTTKAPWQSRTMVLNGLMGLIMFVSLFWAGAVNVKAFIDAHGVEIGMFWSIANLILRAITKDKIGLVD